MIATQRLRSVLFSFLFHPRILPLWNWRRPKFLRVGPLGEVIAERHLLKLGYVILARNHRTKYSELDLVAVDGQVLVFVEVKTRSTLQAGLPTESVDDDKQLRLSQAAVSYRRHHHLRSIPCRFDVIAIDFAQDAHNPRLIHYRNAFESAADCD